MELSCELVENLRWRLTSDEEQRSEGEKEKKTTDGGEVQRWPNLP